MKYNAKEIGTRLRQVRDVFNDGAKLSAEQFAFLLDETGDRIRNYELGRANIPIRLLQTLYTKGINPTFIVVGKGDIFADNEEGNRLKENIRKNSQKGKIENSNYIIKVAAGNIE